MPNGLEEKRMKGIKPNFDECDECIYLKYESDTNSMVCTSKNGCNKQVEE